MTNRKFTPPTEFPAEYVDGHGNKVTILGRSHNEYAPLIGFEHDGFARSWTWEGARFHPSNIKSDLHDIPKRITAWHNVYKSHISESFESRIWADGFAWESRLCVYRIERDEDGGNLKTFTEEV